MYVFFAIHKQYKLGYISFWIGRYVPPDLGDEGYRDQFFTRQHQDDDQYDDFPW